MAEMGGSEASEFSRPASPSAEVGTAGCKTRKRPCTHHDVLPAGLISGLGALLGVPDVDEDEPAVEMVLHVVHVDFLHGSGGDASAAGGAHDGAGARAHGAGRHGGGEGKGSGGSSHARRVVWNVNVCGKVPTRAPAAGG